MRLALVFTFAFNIFFLWAQNADTLKENVIFLHNQIRQTLQKSPLQRSIELEKKATDELKILCQKPYSYHVTDEYGNNQYRSVKYPTSQEIVNFWLREQRYYQGKPVTELGLMQYGHFTQMIWGTTTHIGCALDTTKGGLYIFLCLYSPKGNKIGQKP